MKKVIFAVLFLSLLAIAGVARDIEVSVEVQSDNAEIEKKVEKYLADKINLMEKTKVGDNGKWNILVMVTENTSEDKTENVYTISAVITSDSNCSDPQSGTKTVSTNACARFENFGVFAGSESDLKDMCDELVADFYEGSLEPLR